MVYAIIILMVLVGIFLILKGLYLFLKLFIRLCQALFYLFFASEKMLDRKLFKIWEKEKDYQEFEKDLDRLTR